MSGWICTSGAWGQQTELTDHYLVNAYANGWHVPKTGQYTITLEFTPQLMHEVGVIVSSIAFITRVGYLVWVEFGGGKSDRPSA